MIHQRSFLMPAPRIIAEEGFHTFGTHCVPEVSSDHCRVTLHKEGERLGRHYHSSYRRRLREVMEFTQQEAWKTLVQVRHG